MTTTSTFVGFDENAKVSSRVLKPPGGGSSISFGEPDEPVVAPKGRQQPKTSPFATEETPAPVEQKSENGSSEAAPAAEAESAPEKISEEAESPSKIEKEETKQNGTVPVTDSNNGSNEDFPSVSFDSKSVGKEAEKYEAPVSKSNGTDHKENEEASKPMENFPPIISSQTSVKEPSQTPTESTNGTAETNGHSSNGDVEECTQFSKVEQAPVVSEKSSKSVERSTSVTSNNEESAPVSLSRQNSTTPKVMPNNHHMKSSIYMQEEDHKFIKPPTSRRKSEASPTKEKESPVYQQQPPTRVRQPPGGFSTALW